MICKSKYLLFLTTLTLLQPPLIYNHAQAAPVTLAFNLSEQALVLGAGIPLTQTSIYAEKQNYSTQLKKTRLAKKSGQKDPLAWNCQKWAAKRMGVVFGTRSAAAIPVRSKVPVENSAILTWENSRGTSSGHVGVTLYWTEKDVTFIEANYTPGQVTIRTMALNDPRLRGFWFPDSV